MAHALREKAAISGIGETAYTRGTTKSGLALQLEASLKAIDDAGLKPRDDGGDMGGRTLTEHRVDQRQADRAAEIAHQVEQTAGIRHEKRIKAAQS